MQVSPVRVLIADDSEVLRSHLHGLLDDLDCIDLVAEADSAMTALEQVDVVDPDVVVLDIEMPGGGIRALQAIKRSHPDTFVMMLTNHAGTFYRKVCLNAGADYFVDKAMEFETVPDVIASLAKA